MQVLPAKMYNDYSKSDFASQNPQFGHSHSAHKESNYKPSEKALIVGMSALGVLGSLALLAKGAKYSLKPSKMFKDIKHSYLGEVEFGAKEVIAIGTGSSLGGLAAGYIVDKDKDNRRAKRRETLMQIGNVSIPILSVDLLVDKLCKNSSEVVKAVAGLGGLAAGVILANFIMNKINNFLFDEPKGESRRIKFTDFSAHLDDVVVSAEYIAPKSKIVYAISRIIPAVLVVPGVEVGNKQAKNNIQF